MCHVFSHLETSLKKKKCKKAKWLTEEALQIAVQRREAKSKGEKERYKHLNAKKFRSLNILLFVILSPILHYKYKLLHF